MKEKAAKVDIRNRRASHDYEFIDTYTAGIVLAGTEIKSVRAGKASLSDSYCYFNRGELYVRNMHITEYFWASYNRKDPKRDRKLLLQRRELNKLERQIKEKGLTIVPVRLFIASNGYAKVEIALCRGKKEYDKRQSIKEKDMQRASQRGEDY